MSVSLDSSRARRSERAHESSARAGLRLSTDARVPASTGAGARIFSRASAALAVAVLIAGYQFAPYLPHLLAAQLGQAHEEQLTYDFPTFYGAAVAYRTGGNPYDLATPAGGAKIFPFLYPPTSLPVFFPLALGGIDGSLLAFQLVSFGCLIYLMFAVIWAAEEQQWPLSWRVVSLVVLASFSAIDFTLQSGQVNIIATAAILFVWLRIRESRESSAVACALAIFIATLLKTYPILLLVLFIIRRDFKVIGWFAIFAAADAALCWMTVPREVWRTWIVDVMPTGRFGLQPRGLVPPSSPFNQSLNGALSRVFGGDMAGRIGTIVQAVVLGSTTLVCWTLRKQERRDYYDVGFGVMAAASFLIAPLSWFHHFVFLIPALAACASILSRSEMRHSAAWNSALLFITVLISVRWPIIIRDSRAAHALMTLPILGPLALFVMLVALSFAVWRRGGTRETETGRSVQRRL